MFTTYRNCCGICIEIAPTDNPFVEHHILVRLIGIPAMKNSPILSHRFWSLFREALCQFFMTIDPHSWIINNLAVVWPPISKSQLFELTEFSWELFRGAPQLPPYVWERVANLLSLDGSGWFFLVILLKCKDIGMRGFMDFCTGPSHYHINHPIFNFYPILPRSPSSLLG